MEQDELAIRFTYQPPRDDQPERYQAIRALAHTMAVRLNELCPDCREKHLALTNLEQAVMWANASIARREEP